MYINYSDLSLSKNKEYKMVEFNNNYIKVSSYLPIADKYDLVSVTIQKSEENGIYNPLKITMYFNLNLVYMYTDIVFTQEDRINEPDIYDSLVCSGLLDKIKSYIPTEEITFLQECLEAQIEELSKYKNTAAALVSSVINDLPKNAEMVAEMMKEFNPEDFQNIIDITKNLKGQA